MPAWEPASVDRLIAKRLVAQVTGVGFSYLLKNLQDETVGIYVGRALKGRALGTSFGALMSAPARPSISTEPQMEQLRLASRCRKPFSTSL